MYMKMKIENLKLKWKSLLFGFISSACTTLCNTSHDVGLFYVTVSASMSLSSATALLFHYFLLVQQMPLDFSLFIPDPATPICSPVTSFPSPEPPHPSPNLYFVPWSATHYVYHPRSFVRLSVFLSCYVSLLAFGFASELFVTWNWACLPLCLLSVYLLSVYMPACLPTCTCQWAIFV